MTWNCYDFEKYDTQSFLGDCKLLSEKTCSLVILICCLHSRTLHSHLLARVSGADSAGVAAVSLAVTALSRLGHALPLPRLVNPLLLCGLMGKDEMSLVSFNVYKGIT